MNFLARKISRAKWEPAPYTGPEGIRADAITGSCLRTQNDTLSLWKCTPNDADVSEVVLALASTMEKIEAMHIVLLDQNYLQANGFVIENTPENTHTPIDDLRGRHVDLINLTMAQITFLATDIAAKIRQNTGFYLFTKRAILEQLASAVKVSRLALNSLQDKVKLEVQNYL